MPNFFCIVVVKMLAVMEAASQTPSGSNLASSAAVTPDSTNAQEFLASGRTGRRNALPDILGNFSFYSIPH